MASSSASLMLSILMIYEAVVLNSAQEHNKNIPFGFLGQWSYLCACEEWG